MQRFRVQGLALSVSHARGQATRRLGDLRKPKVGMSEGVLSFDCPICAAPEARNPKTLSSQPLKPQTLKP